VSPASDLADNELRRQLATLALSHVQPSGPVEAIAAASWWNMLARLGFRVPLSVVHDFGLLLSRNREGSRREIARPSGNPPLARYRALLAAVASSEVVQDLGTLPLRDETVAVILARLIGDVYLRWAGRPRTWSDVEELPMSSPSYDEDRVTLARERDPAWSLPFIQRLGEHDRAVLARLDQIDAGVLRLLGLFSFQAGVSDLADLYQLVSSSGAADIVDFSLQLLPSLLETKRRPAAQRFSIDGYASVERRGNFDALLPGELAHDDEIFGLKVLSDELLYYGHERQHEAAREDLARSTHRRARIDEDVMQPARRVLAPLVAVVQQVVGQRLEPEDLVLVRQLAGQERVEVPAPLDRRVAVDGEALRRRTALGLQQRRQKL